VRNSKYRVLCAWGVTGTSVALTCLGLLLMIFVIFQLVPIDPVLTLVGDRASEATYNSVRTELGLHLSWPQQFVVYLNKVVHLDFGYSLLTSNPVLEDISRVFPATLELAAVAIILGSGIGIPFGIVSAVYQNKWPDNLLRIISLLGNSLSIFWLGLMGLVVFYANLGWLPGPGRVDIKYLGDGDAQGFIIIKSFFTANWPLFIDAVKHIIMPAGILAFYNLAHISRMTRTFMIEQLSQEYIQTARIKGVTEWNIITRHAFPNIATPLLTVVILGFATLLEGSTFVEIIFMWPGLGYYLSRSLMNADLNATLCCTVIIGFIFISFNLFADYLYKYLDPRTRMK